MVADELTIFRATVIHFKLEVSLLRISQCCDRAHIHVPDVALRGSMREPIDNNFLQENVVNGDSIAS
jgi:hypothetical protein